MDTDKMGIMNTLDSIPDPKPNAPKIVGLVKDGNSVTGYKLSDGQILDKQQCVDLAKNGGVADVAVASRDGTEYLKSIPDGTENNNLSHLPTVDE